MPTASKVWNGNAELKRLLVPITDLRPHPQNPRRGDVEAIRASLERFGQQRPILALPDGTVVAGNHTLRAATEAGWTHIAVVRSDLTEAEVEAYLLADNRTGDLGEYEDDILAALLKPMYDADTLRGTGYERDDVEELLAELAWRSRGKVDAEPDASPPIPEHPVSEEGTRYELGRHVLVCGDAFSEEHHLLLGDRVDCILTDPPYGINLMTDYTQHPHGSSAAEVKLASKRRSYPKVIGDDAPFDASWIVERYAKVKEQFWFGGDFYRRTLSPRDLDGAYLVWDKRIDTQSDKRIGSGFELVWSKQAHKRDVLRHYWNGAFGAPEARNRMHPTQKPIAVLEEILNRWTKPQANVLDPFAGSGSTLIACEHVGRRALVMELSPAYCDVIRQRYADFTGQPEYAP